MAEMKTILVVDDDQHMRQFASVALSHAGYEVVLAGNGLEGLATAIRLNPDLIVLDVMMPGEMDGLAVCHMLRNNQQMRMTPVLILSGLNQEVDVQAGHLYGCTDYLTKPITIRKLQSAVAALLESSVSRSSSSL